LGVNYRNLAEELTADGKSRKGAILAKNGNDPAIVKGGPAEIAGLKEGDIIISVNSAEIDRNNDLCAIIAGFASGDEVVVAYERNGESKQVKIKL
jgi:putative serine protease PepD